MKMVLWLMVTSLLLHVIQNSAEKKETCARFQQQCSQNAMCTDYATGLCCHCQPGFYGNGRHCLPDGAPQRVSGKVMGTVSVGVIPVELNNLVLRAYIMVGDGRAIMAIGKVPNSVGWALMPVAPIGELFGWLFALELPNSQAGFRITGAEFTRHVEMIFHPGLERLSIMQTGRGLDHHNHLTVDTDISGTVPFLPPGAAVTMEPFNETYQFYPSVVTSTSVREYSVVSAERGSESFSYKLQQNITYSDCRHNHRQSPETLQVTVEKVSAMYVEESILRYIITNKIEPVGAPQVQPTVNTTESDDVRLVGGTSHCAGTLEVKRQGDWRPAADSTSNWNLKSSSVVCKKLDCGSALDTKHGHGSTRQPVWWITSSCDESTWRECAMQPGISVERLEVTCSALFSQCGRPDPPDTDKVVRGRPSLPGHHPWQVSLQRRDTGSSKRFTHACGGVLIASCWVLTASHCINSSKEMQVVVGALDHKYPERYAQVISVVDYIRHPEYKISRFPDDEDSTSAIHNDIALLQLNVTKGPLCAVESRYVKTVCLPNQLFPDGLECVISGWGRTRQREKRGCRSPEVEGGFFAPEKETYPHGATIHYRCDQRHKPNAEGWWATSSCQDGNWAHTPQCIGLKDCLGPEIPNAHYPRRSYKDGETIRIKCDEGYEIGDDILTATCRQGYWTSLPICYKDVFGCTQPDEIPHAVIMHEYQTMFPDEKTLSYECKKGYSVAQGKSKSIMCVLGLWDWDLVAPCDRDSAPGVSTPTGTGHALVPSQRGETDCPAPKLEGGFFAPEKGSYPHEATIHYRCDQGRKPNVEGWWATSSCQNGSWTQTPQCIDEYDCLNPKIPNAQCTPPPYENGKQIMIKCNEGYTLSGSVSTTCRDGSWTSPPICERDINACPQPDEIPHAVIMYEYQTMFPDRRNVSFQCEKGYYVAQGKGKSIVCSRGQWYGIESCFMPESCGPPDAEHAEFQLMEGDDFVFGSEVQYTCRPGYQLVRGSSKRRCTFNGWDGAAPVCQICSSYLGIEYERRLVTDDQLTASSVYSTSYPAYDARLGNGNSWFPATDDRRQWLQVDLKHPKTITGIITQGGGGYKYYVKSFKVSHSDDGRSWTIIKEANGSDKIFTGNHDWFTFKENLFESPITRRFVRVHPMAWYNGIALRIELLGCVQCGPPGDAEHAEWQLVEGEDFVFGSEVEYTCHPSYQLVRGSTGKRRCKSNGWDGAAPVCQCTVHVLSGTGNCPVWYSYNGRYFSIVTRHMTWRDAELNCQSQGAHLASIHSKEEHDFIRTLIQNVQPLQLHKWIGLNDLDVEGRWVWADGSKVDYTGWIGGNPNGGRAENCVVTHDFMHDYPCSHGFTSVCVLGT